MASYQEQNTSPCDDEFNFQTWAEESKLNKRTIDLLTEEDLDSEAVLKLMQENDIQSLPLTMGQKLRLREGVRKLKTREESGSSDLDIERKGTISEVNVEQESHHRLQRTYEDVTKEQDLTVLMTAMDADLDALRKEVEKLDNNVDKKLKKYEEGVVRSPDMDALKKDIIMQYKFQLSNNSFQVSKTPPDMVQMLAKGQQGCHIKDDYKIQNKNVEERLAGLNRLEENAVNKQDLLAVKKEIMNTLEDRLTSNPSVAFSVYAGRKLKNLKEYDTLVYDSVITNIGSAYNKDTGQFRCPENGDGMYFITATTMCFPNDEIETEIVLNSNPIPVKLYAGAAVYRHNQGTNSCIISLKAGDLVYVRVNCVYPNARNHVVHAWHYWSTFTGFRITYFT